MSRLDAQLARARAEGRGAFMPFLVLGDPDPATSLDLARALGRSGADVLEFGFAFSDPPADGPVIQAADQRALAAGMTPARSFELLAELRRELSQPFTLLVYYNLLLRFGLERFCQRAREVGVDAMLVADVPLEEAGPLHQAMQAAELAPIMVISELTSAERLERLLSAARGYLYVVGHLGVTGARDQLAPGLAPLLARLGQRTSLPRLVGFGISTPAQASAAIDLGAEGVIVGSALVAEIAQNLRDPPRMVQALEGKARAFAGALRRG